VRLSGSVRPPFSGKPRNNSSLDTPLTMAVEQDFQSVASNCNTQRNSSSFLSARRPFQELYPLLVESILSGGP
jgi:hypothetical protein